MTTLFAKALLLTLAMVITMGCQMGYLVKSGYNQMKLLSSRTPLDEALESSQLTDEEKRKLRLAQEARHFAENVLHLTPTKNYTSYVKLDRPYVTYVVSAAPRWELKHFEWSYPLVGKMPYKGYFNEADAKTEEQELQKENLDTYLRGVSAYSTLGWFKDPILSSMLRYDDYDLVNTIIHETVHATLYIKHAADFNEQLATFMGHKGAEKFYEKKEGAGSATLKAVQLENTDAKVFSEFITQEIKSLEKWYQELPENSRSEAARKTRINQIQQKFKEKILPRLKTDAHKTFPDIALNNARLLVYKTYMQDLSDFEALYEKVDGDFKKFIEKCKSLESSKNPSEDLKKLI